MGVVGGRVESLQHHTKGVKNGTSSSLADAHIKNGIARKIKLDKYLLMDICFVAK